MTELPYTLLSLPKEERPRERLARYGAEVLSTAELLAIILGSGTRGSSVLQLAQQLLATYGDIARLSEATLAELCQLKGIGHAKALQLKAAFGLVNRLQQQGLRQRCQVANPWQAYHLLKEPYASAKQEHFLAVLQDTKGYLISCEVISIGTLNETLVHPREVFYPAVRHKAFSIILAHNHPSGDPEPSPADIAITKQLCQVGTLMEIPVVDHLILTPSRFISLRERGLDCFPKVKV